MNIIYSKIKNLSPRSILAFKNIGWSFIYKFIIILLNLYVVRLSLQYLGQENYGIWLTIGAMINWLEISDLGIGHGLRNKLAESLASNDYGLAKKYVSTTYFISILISIILILIFSLLIYNVDWYIILNTNAEKESILKSIAIIAFMSFAVRLTLKLFSSVLLADQRPSFRILLQLIFKSIMVIGLIFTLKINLNNLISYAFIFSITPLIIYLIFSLIYYNRQYKKIRPSISSFDKTKIKSLTSLGFNFLFLQLSSVMLFQADNIFITYLFSPSEVTTYQISYKYFSIVPVAMTIFVTPYWSAFTEAFHKKDFDWMKNSVLGLNFLWFIFSFASLFLLLFSENLFEIWLGENLFIDKSLKIGFYVFTLLFSLDVVYSQLLNGIGKVRLQVYLAFFNIIIHLPLAFIFAINFNLGTTGIILSTIVSHFIMLFFKIIQLRKLVILKNANGIWNK